jgi:Outer membrane protein beta-barrel domain
MKASSEDDSSMSFRAKINLKSTLGGLLAGVVVAAISNSAVAQPSGYFSGIRLTTPGTGNGAWSFAAPGLKLGQALEYSRVTDVPNVGAQSTTTFGGYQFGSGLALGAALSTAQNGVFSPTSFNDPSSATDSSSGIGLRFDGARWAQSRSSAVNLDVVSAFNLGSALSLYGKVGIVRSESRFGEVIPLNTSVDRTALSYGAGVRYDFNQSLGLKFEVSRGSYFGVNPGLGRIRSDAELDSINLGLRWTF